MVVYLLFHDSWDYDHHHDLIGVFEIFEGARTYANTLAPLRPPVLEPMEIEYDPKEAGMTVWIWSEDPKEYSAEEAYRIERWKVV